jgi:hypothetical protein
VLRTTTVGYLNGSNYAAANIINRVQDELIADSTGTIKSRTHINYDEAGLINSICVTGAVQHDDTNFDCSYLTRGLPTSVTTYADAATPAGAVTRTSSYDSLGNLVSKQLNCCQQKQWNFSVATQYAFPDSVVSGPAGASQLTSSATYYLTTGQIRTSTDENGQVSKYSYLDPGHLDRLVDLQRPDGAHLSWAYDDTSHTVTSSSPIQGTNVIQEMTAFDALGRPITKKVEDGSSAIYSIVQTQYDSLSRPYMISNPYTTSAQFFTTSQFDALGRPTITEPPDGASGQASYTLNSATITDPGGKQRRSFTDGLGRAIEVDEPGDSIPGAQAKGSITINDPLNSKPTIPGTSGQASFVLKGSEGTTIICTRTCTSHPDSGSVSVTINVPGNPVIATATYSSNANTAQTLASALATTLANTGFFVNVNTVNTTGPDGIPAFTVTLTAKASGSITNYVYSTTAAGAKKDFTATAAGPSFTGGTDGQNGAVDGLRCSRRKRRSLP